MVERLVKHRDDVLMNQKDHPVGSRLIVSDDSSFGDLREVKVLEWSDSGDYVKLKYSGKECWERCRKYKPVVMEVLSSSEKSQPSASRIERLHRLIRRVKVGHDNAEMGEALADGIEFDPGDEAAGTIHEAFDRISRTVLEAHPKILPDDFQQRVDEWLIRTFGYLIAESPLERILRATEEFFEVAQAFGLSFQDVCKVGQYVFSREPGEPRMELGGLMTCLAALANAHGISLSEVAEAELTRIDGMSDTIAQKWTNKPFWMTIINEVSLEQSKAYRLKSLPGVSE